MESLVAKKKVVVVGSGDKAHGLAHMYECNAKKGCCDFIFTEPLPTQVYAPFNEYVSIEPFPEAIKNADIVILAIPSYAIESFLIQNFSLLKDSCILVDLTNANKDKKDLKGALAALEIDFDRWVKAFNDTGAIQELQHKAESKTKIATNVCGPNEDSVSQVVAFAELLGFLAKAVPFDQFRDLRVSQDTIGWEWKHSTFFMVVLFLLVFTYVVIQVHERPNFEWYTLLARHSSKMFAWTSVYGFAFSLLPGTLIRLIQQIRTSFVPPRILTWGCEIRKHVGLLSLYFLFLHACMMLLLFGSEYFGFLLTEGHMEWNDEASMLTAVLSTSLFIITGIASLPSVGNAMNKAQFMLVFGPVVWGALALGVMHIMFLGVPSWTESPRSKYAWAGDMPPVTLMSSVFPLFILLIKFVQVVLSWLLFIKNKFIIKRDLSSVHPSNDVGNSTKVEVAVEV